jgi:TRAP-type mannitol/chloroaromatic compound transport system permease small subunit
MRIDAQATHGQTPAWKRFSLLHAIEGNVRIIENWLNLCSVFIIMFLMFFATAEILGRYLFNSPIPGHVEIVELIMAGVVFFGIAYTGRVVCHPFRQSFSLYTFYYRNHSAFMSGYSRH